jgi:hypothetical protein
MEVLFSLSKWQFASYLSESRKNTKNSAKSNFFLFLLVIFALLDPDPDCESGSGDPIESNSDSDQQHCFLFDDNEWRSSNFSIRMNGSILSSDYNEW